MILRKYIAFFALIIAFTTSASVFGFVFANSSNPPNLNYERVFDLSALHQKHKNLLYDMGCGANVFGAIVHSNENTYIPIPNAHSRLNPDMFKQLQDYQKECVKHLQRAHQWAAFEPALYNGATLALLGGVIAGLCYYDPSSWNFTLLYYACYSTILLREIAPSVFGFFFPNNQSLSMLENEFAQHQCFIPRDFWKPLIHKFTLHTQEKNSQFLDFALGLKVYYPKTNIDETKTDYGTFVMALNRKLNDFFCEYEESQNLSLELGAKIASFAAQLYDQKAEPICLYLKGAPGIGKTHFPKILSQFFEEMMPQKTAFVSGKIQTHNDLEGNQTKPGLILKSYRNLLNDPNKIGLILHIDELSLEDQNLKHAFKRVFNGSESEIPQHYLTQNGFPDIKLPLVPMLIIFTNNQMDSRNPEYSEEDNAIESRLHSHSFPKPKKETLLKSAKRFIQNHKLRYYVYDFESRISNLDVQLEEISDFRSAFHKSEILLYKWFIESQER